jgi:hypothetical protein
MKNLESFGVQELGARETKEINGGFLGTLIFGAIVLIAGILLEKKFAN